MKHVACQSNTTVRIVASLVGLIVLVGCGGDSLDGISGDVNSIRRAVDRVEENQKSMQKEIVRREESSSRLAEELKMIPRLAEESKAIREELSELREAEQEQRKELVDEIELRVCEQRNDVVAATNGLLRTARQKSLDHATFRTQNGKLC
jgi:membrane protein involved in colicin uptake